MNVLYSEGERGEETSNNTLNIGPFLWILCLNGTSIVTSHHVGDLWVRSFHQHPSVGGDVVHELVQSGPLDLLALQVHHRVQEVEEHAALLELLGEELLLLCGGGIWNHTEEKETLSHCSYAQWNT